MAVRRYLIWSLLFTVAGVSGVFAQAPSEPKPWRVGVLRDWPPQYSLDDDGNPTGFGVEVFEAIAAQAGVEYRYVIFDSFPQLIRALEREQVDLIPNMGILEARRAHMAFTHPVEVFELRLFTRATQRSIDGPEDLTGGARVGVVNSNAAVELFRSSSHMHVQTYPDARSALFDLLAGDVDAIAYPRSVLWAMARDAGVDHRLREAPAHLREIKRAIAVRPTAPALRRKLDVATEAFVESPAYHTIYQRWYGREPGFWTARRVAWAAAAAFFVALCSVVAWRIRTLRRHNRELQTAQRALASREAQYRLIMETTREGVWLIDADDRTTYVNPRMAQMLGWAPEEMMGRRAWDFSDPAQREEGEKAMERRREGSAERHDFQLVTKNGGKIWASMSATPIFDGERYMGALAMVSDVTERHLLREQLLQSQKLEAVGQLAGGVAHDFNNLLMVIGASVDLLRMHCGSLPEAMDELGHLEAAWERAQGVTQQLLSFARRDVSQPKPVTPARRIHDSAPILKRLVSENIELTLPKADLAGAVHIDPVQLDQVVMNLVINARDAMPEGGTLRIQVQRERRDEGGGLPAGDYVRIDVADSGTGMSESTRRRLFEPFYTTKGHDRGTGLGLATSQGIVQRAGGTITVDTKLGEGSCFHVYLPVIHPQQEQPILTSVAPQSSASPRLCVLVVEDDSDLRRVIHRLIEDQAEVVEVTTPERALELLKEAGTRVDVLLTDVVMPGMGGRELARQARALHPTLRIVYMSGYPDGAPDESKPLQSHEAFLHKPFSKTELRAAVRATSPLPTTHNDLSQQAL